MLNKHRRWFHSSRVKCPLVKMSASWFLDPTYQIWILGSTLILSKNQSRAALWVLETCLRVRLLPLMIILISASLSSKTCNAPSREECMFEETESAFDNSRCLWHACVLHCGFICFFEALQLNGSLRSFLNFCVWFGFERDTSMTKSQRSSAGIPCMRRPASRGISDPVELCDTHVCLLHIQLIGAHVWLPNMHNVPPEVDFESSRSPAKSESWNCASRHCCAVCPTWQYCLYLLVQWMWEINALNVCRMLWSTLWSHVQVCWLPVRGKYRHFWTNCEHTSDN